MGKWVFVWILICCLGFWLVLFFVSELVCLWSVGVDRIGSGVEFGRIVSVSVEQEVRERVFQGMRLSSVRRFWRG